MSRLPEESPRAPDAARGQDPVLNQAAEVESREQGLPDRPKEIGGRKGLEPTRYGDWEKNGRCIDF